MASSSCSYSIDGYLAALKIRAAPTILLEGVTDRKITARVIAGLEEYKVIRAGLIQIDTVDLIDGRSVMLDGRQLVEHLHSKATSEGFSLAALVDREFREFHIAETIADKVEDHMVIDGSLFWTRGHSIENYFFEGKHITAFLKFHCPENLPGTCYQYVAASLPHLYVWAAAFSIAAFRSGILRKCRGLVKLRHWDEADGTVKLNLQAIETDLKARSIRPEAVINFIQTTTQYHQKCLDLIDKSVSRWIAHGHLGQEIIWSGIGKLLQSIGVEPAVVNAIGHGQVELKLRKSADLWFEEILAGTAVSPDALWSWVKQAGKVGK
jgi:hypothetical protein